MAGNAGVARRSAVVLLGLTCFAWTGLAQDAALPPGTVLYATDAGVPGGNPTASNLYTIDIETAEATLIGPLVGPQVQPADGAQPVVQWSTANALIFSYGGPSFINEAPRLLAVANPPPIPFSPQVPYLVSIDPATGSVTSEGPPLPPAEYYPPGPQSTKIDQRNVPRPFLPMFDDPLPEECRVPDPECAISDIGRFDPLNVLFALGLCGDANPFFMILFEEPANFFSQPQDQCTYRELVGQTGMLGLSQGIAFQPGSNFRFYATNFDLVETSLQTIDPFTGVATVVPGSAPIEGNVNAIDFHPMSGQLYGAQIVAGENFLSVIDLETGVATPIGEVLVDGAPLPYELRAIAFSPFLGCPGAPLGLDVQINSEITSPPTMACREPNFRGGASFSLTRRGSLSFKGQIGSSLDKNTVGNPIATNPPAQGQPARGREFRLCLYQEDEVLGGQRLIAGAQIPGGDNWQGTRGGFRYRDSEGLPDGVTSARLQAIVRPRQAGRGDLRVRAQDIGLPLPLSDSTLHVQFSDDRGVDAASGADVLNSLKDCYGASFDDPTRNTSRSYRSKSD